MEEEEEEALPLYMSAGSSLGFSEGSSQVQHATDTPSYPVLWWPVGTMLGDCQESLRVGSSDTPLLSPS